MLVNFKVTGFKVFNREVSLSFRANKKIKNKDYVFSFRDEEILKSAIIYGPNNTGKSALIESLDCLKKIIKNGKITDNFLYTFDFNFFNETKKITYEIEFVEDEVQFKYLLSFAQKGIILDEILHINNEKLFDRNELNEDKELQDAINLISTYNNMLIIATLPLKHKQYTDSISKFFENMLILRKYFDFNEVINDLSSLNKKEFNKFNNIMKSADVSIDNLQINSKMDDSTKELKLFSDYVMNNIRISMPSFISDSDGTRVFMYYMVKIQQCMKQGGLIVIDEIDRSLHTLLTKNIISIFNDEKNVRAQLLTTSHDLLLLDCLYLFRKDQVWFTYKDDKEVYLYSLDNFKSNIDLQIRNKTMESYLKGLFGALPHPNIEEYIFDE